MTAASLCLRGRLTGTAATYLCPRGRLTGTAASGAIAAGVALPSGRDGEAWALIEGWIRRPGGGADRVIRPALAWADEGETGRLTARRCWAGAPLDRPLVVGIVNVTPDSFSDGGRYLDPAAAIAHGRALLGAGADWLDIGGESTRPGALPIDPDEEARRVEPVIRALAEAGAAVSVDTRRPAVMATALAAGARAINDVTALADPDALRLVAGTRAAVILMHMQGEPQTMQQAPHYDVALLDVYDHLAMRVAACRAAGIGDDRLAIDPGIGFGKSLAQNLELLDGLALFRGLGVAVMLGVSRKSLIGRLTGIDQPADRMAGSLALALAGVAAGADLLRVHDVAETVQALKATRDR